MPTPHTVTLELTVVEMSWLDDRIVIFLDLLHSPLEPQQFSVASAYASHWQTNVALVPGSRELPAAIWSRKSSIPLGEALEKTIWCARPDELVHAVSASQGAQMELRIAILCLVMILGNPALAQVSNQRDMYGNLVRNGGGASSQTGVNQSTPNSSGAIRNPPIPQSTNPTSPRAQQINRLGAGTN